MLHFNTKSTFESEKDTILNNNSLIKDKNISMNDRPRITKKSSFLNINKNTNIKYNPLTHSPKKFNQSNFYENSLFSKFNNFKPKKAKDSNSYFRDNTNMNFNMSSILSNAFTIKNSDKQNLTENKTLTDYNIKIKQNLIKYNKNYLFKQSPFTNKVESNSTGKVKVLPNKIKAQASIMDIILPDKSNKDFMNKGNNINIFTTKNENESNKRVLNISQEHLKNEINSMNAVQETNNNYKTNKHNQQKIIYSNSKINSIDKDYLNSIFKNNKINSRNHKDIFILDEIDSNKNGYSNETVSQAANKNNTNKSHNNKGEYSNNFIEGKINNYIENYEKTKNHERNKKKTQTDVLICKNNQDEMIIDNFNNISSNHSNFVANNKLYKFIQENRKSTDHRNVLVNHNNLRQCSEDRNISNKKIVQNINTIDAHSTNIISDKKNYVKFVSKPNKTISYSLCKNGSQIRSYSDKIKRQLFFNKTILTKHNKFKKPNLNSLLLRRSSIINSKKEFVSVSDEKKKEVSGSIGKDMKKYNDMILLRELKSKSKDNKKKEIEDSFSNSNRTNNLNKNNKNICFLNQFTEGYVYYTKKKEDKSLNLQSQKRYINKNQKNITNNENFDSEEYKIRNNQNLINNMIDKNYKTIDLININTIDNICVTDINHDLSTEEKKLLKKSTKEIINNSSNYIGYKSKKKTNYSNYSTYENLKKEKKFNKHYNNPTIKLNSYCLKTNSSEEKFTRTNNISFLKKYNLNPGILNNAHENDKFKNIFDNNKHLKSKEQAKDKNLKIKKENLGKFIDKNLKNDFIYMLHNSKINNCIKNQENSFKKQNQKKKVDNINIKNCIIKNDNSNREKENVDNFDKSQFGEINKDGNLDYDLMNKIIDGLDEEFRGLFNFSYDNFINKDKSESASLLSEIEDEL